MECRVVRDRNGVPVQGLKRVMLMTRRIARERAVQFLFQMDLNPEDPDSALSRFWEERKINVNARRFAEELIHGVLDNLESINSKLQSYADHWDVRRMGVVDRNILRLAMYEMLFRQDIPPVVSINEAVDIAKRFSCNESGRFVNGILDRAKDDLCRPAREAVAKGMVDEKSAEENT